MKKKIEELNHLINDYLLAIGADDNFVYTNIEYLYNINFKVFEILNKKFENNDIDIINIRHSTWYQNIELIKEFYKIYNINFDVDKALKDGTIDYTYYDEINMFNIEDGECYYRDGHKGINACNNGLISDAAVLVHELSHLRNQPDDYREQINSLFTESLATLDELLFIDFLEKKGYKEEAKWLRKSLYMFFYENSFMSIPIFELFLLYNKVGSISEESFKFYYGTTDDYQEDISEIEDLDNYELDTRCDYMLASLLAPYLYYKVKKDKTYMNVVKAFYDVINSGDIDECLNYIDLHELDDNACEKLYNNLKKFIKKKI